MYRNCIIAMKKLLILIALFAIVAGASAQLRVQANGEVTIHAQTQDWWPALKLVVPTKSSYGSTLWSLYYNKYVFSLGK